MISPPRLGTGLLAAALLCLAVPLHAAPAPDEPAVKIDKYLPDDTGGVFVVDVKQILASKAFTKDVKKQIEDVLKMDQVQMVLKDSGFDPLKDVDRIIQAITPGVEGNRSGAVFFIIEGRFNAGKLKAKAAELAKTFPNFKEVEIGKATAYEFGPKDDGYVALVDKNTLVLAASKEEMTQAIEKAGTRKTEFKSKSLAKLIAKMDPKLAVNVACASDMAYLGTTHHKGGTVVHTVDTLADQGIESVTGGLEVGEEIKGKVNVTAKDADTAKKLAANFQAIVAESTARLTKDAEVQKEFAPLIDVLNSLKVMNKEQTFTVESKAGTDAFVAIIKSWFMVRPPAKVPPPPPPGK